MGSARVPGQGYRTSGTVIDGATGAERATKAAVLLAIALAAFAISMFPVRKSHWWDETVYLQHAEILFSGRDNYNEFWLRPPLFPILISLFYVLWHNEAMAHAVVAATFSLLAFSTYMMGRRLGGEGSGILAYSLFLTSPVVLDASGWVMTDIPMLLPFSLSIYFILDREGTGLSGIFLGIASLTRFSSLFLAPVMAIYSAMHGIRVMARFVSCLFITLLPFLLWSASEFRSPFAVFASARNAVAYPVDSVAVYAYGITELLSIPIVFGLLLFVATGARRLGRREMLLLALSVAFSVSLIVTPHKEIRYAIPLVFLVSLLAGKGLSAVSRIHPVLPYVLSLIMVASSLSSDWRGFYNSWTSPEIEASSLLVSMNATLVYTSGNHPVFAYYTGAEVVPSPSDSRIFSFLHRIGKEGYLVWYGNGEVDEKDFEMTGEFEQMGKVDGIRIYRFVPRNPVSGRSNG